MLFSRVLSGGMETQISAPLGGGARAQGLRLPPNPTVLCLSRGGGVERRQTCHPTCPPAQPWREHPLGARCHRG